MCATRLLKTSRETTHFETGELKENHAKISLNAKHLIGGKDNRFWRLGSGHTALLFNRSHRWYFKASNGRNFALFLRFSDGVFPIFFVATVGGSIELGALDKIARSIELHVRFDTRRRENSAFNLKMLLD